MTFSELPINTPYINTNGYVSMIVHEAKKRQPYIMNHNGSYYNISRETTYSVHKNLKLVDMTPLEFFEQMPKGNLKGSTNYRFKKTFMYYKEKYLKSLGHISLPYTHELLLIC